MFQEFNFSVPGFFSIPYMSVFVIIAAVFFIAFCIWQYEYNCHFSLKPGEIAVISRMGQIRVVQAGDVWLVPFIEEVSFLPLVPVDFDIEISDLQNIEGFNLMVSVRVRASVDDSPSSIEKAVGYFKSSLDLFSVVSELFKSSISIALIETGADMSILSRDPLPVFEASEDMLRSELFERGVILLKLELLSIDDSEGIIKRLGKGGFK